MTPLAVIRSALVRPFASGPGCVSCTHFHDDPAQVERALPGLVALSSAYASVRAQDGLCVEHGRIVNGRRRCDSFTQG